MQKVREEFFNFLVCLFLRKVSFAEGSAEGSVEVSHSRGSCVKDCLDEGGMYVLTYVWLCLFFPKKLCFMGSLNF